MRLGKEVGLVQGTKCVVVATKWITIFYRINARAFISFKERHTGHLFETGVYLSTGVHFFGDYTVPYRHTCFEYHHAPL